MQRQKRNWIVINISREIIQFENIGDSILQKSIFLDLKNLVFIKNIVFISFAHLEFFILNISSSFL